MVLTSMLDNAECSMGEMCCRLYMVDWKRVQWHGKARIPLAQYDVLLWTTLLGICAAAWLVCIFRHEHICQVVLPITEHHTAMLHAFTVVAANPQSRHHMMVMCSLNKSSHQIKHCCSWVRKCFTTSSGSSAYPRSISCWYCTRTSCIWVE